MPEKKYAERWRRYIEHGTRQRAVILSYYDEHPEEREAELQKCAEDFIYWNDRWAWTIDPRLMRFGISGQVPLILLPAQRNMVDWTFERFAVGEDGVIEKSRGQGATWIFTSLSVWFLLFKPSSSVGVGSRKEELVDKLGDSDSILEKCRYILQHLPEWMLPQEREIEDKYLLLRNVVIGSQIKGEGGDNIGRGGRNTIYWVDEHAFIPRVERVEAALVDNAASVFRISTHLGENSRFDQLTKELPTFTLHWRDNPLFDDEWYEERKAKYGHDPVMIARELDINPQASISDLMIPSEWLDACKHEPAENHDAEPIVAGFDIAGAGSNKNALVFRQGPVVIDVLWWAGSNDIPHSIYTAVEYCKDRRAKLLIYDAIGIGQSTTGILQRIEDAPFEILPVQGSWAPIKRILANGQYSVDYFLNLKTQLWWNVRERALRKFRGAESEEGHFFVGENPELMSQLLTPTLKFTARGKIRLETKEELQRRGVKSPDEADACILAFSDDVINTEPFVGDPSPTENDFDPRKTVIERASSREKPTEIRSEVRRKYSVFGRTTV